jgi:hypothetical protein
MLTCRAFHRPFRLQHHFVARQEHFAADHRRAVEDLRRTHRVRQRAERLFHFRDAADGAELRELAEELAGIHRLERILVLQLRDHQLQELRLAELIFLLDAAALRSAARCAGAVDDV